MVIQTAEFLSSCTDYRKCPRLDKPEYAFIGRSNVGKSSLINSLLNRKNLARVSATPGKTRLINHFLVNGEWLLADLPGYGYARIAKTERQKWEIMIKDYLTNRKNLVMTFILLDGRIELKESDREMINWFGENQLPFSLVFTKSDKLKPNQLNSNIAAVKNSLLQYWEELPSVYISSSVSGKGTEDILQRISSENRLFYSETL